MSLAPQATDADRLWRIACRLFSLPMDRMATLPDGLGRLPAEFVVVTPASTPEIPDWMMVTNQRLIWREDERLRAIRLGVIIGVRWARDGDYGRLDVWFADGSEINGIPINRRGDALVARLRLAIAEATRFPERLTKDERNVVLRTLDRLRERDALRGIEFRNLLAFFGAKPRVL